VTQQRLKESKSLDVEVNALRQQEPIEAAHGGIGPDGIGGQVFVGSTTTAVP
jgi:hypothetical protein